MEFIVGEKYGWITEEDYNEYKDLVDLSQFFDGGDGKYYILYSDYDDEVELFDYGVEIGFFTYIKSTEAVGPDE